MSAPLDDLLSAYGQAVAPQKDHPPASFTVIVRTQGSRPDSLNEALDSIAEQTHQDFDVVIMVHGADDALAAARASIGDRLDGRRTIAAVAGGGRSAPLNAALEHVSGTHFCFLDDDDLAMPDWLSSFAAAAAAQPGAIVRAVTGSQRWTTSDGQPTQAEGPVERPFPARFDLLAHMSLNLTPICSLAYPQRVISELGLRFDDDLAVYEDWLFLMQAAMAVGVVSIPAQTSLYRRLDAGSADSVETVATWETAHATVIDRLSARPVLLPAGDARRLAGTHFVIEGRSRYEQEALDARATIDQLTRSPWRWLRAFAKRLGGAVRSRTSAPRP